MLRHVMFLTGSVVAALAVGGWVWAETAMTVAAGVCAGDNDCLMGFSAIRAASSAAAVLAVALLAYALYFLDPRRRQA